MKISLSIVISLMLSTAIYSQQIKVYESFDEFENRLYTNSDSIYVVNFWATWCVPCVKEMPYFQQLHDEYKDKKVKVLLVSLDMSRHIYSQVIPFIKKKNLTPEVIVLDDPDQNAWINKVSSVWSGSIPATLIFNKNQRKFYEQSFNYLELVETVNAFIN